MRFIIWESKELHQAEKNYFKFNSDMSIIV